ncbi:hypothetical protein BGZ74_009912 [Mortierella antarctica]|nr:hypothetical protein BGZ74_009912 [Mortierella antarctica]
MVISLIQDSQALATWIVTGAYSTKMTAPSFKDKSSQVVIEQVNLVVANLTVEAASPIQDTSLIVSSTMSTTNTTRRFRVSLGEDVAEFAAISGLETEPPMVAYRVGSDSIFQMPVQRDPFTLILEQGVTAKKGPFFQWMYELAFGPVDKKDLTITLVDDSKVLVTWTILGALPVTFNVSGLGLGSDTVNLKEMTLTAGKATCEFS